MRISTKTTVELGGTTCTVAELKAVLHEHADDSTVRIEYSAADPRDQREQSTARLVITPVDRPTNIGVVPR